MSLSNLENLQDANVETLVERLRASARFRETSFSKNRDLKTQAANRIEELEKEVSRLRALEGPSPGSMRVRNDDEDKPGGGF